MRVLYSIMVRRGGSDGGISTKIQNVYNKLQRFTFRYSAAKFLSLRLPTMCNSVFMKWHHTYLCHGVHACMHSCVRVRVCVCVWWGNDPIDRFHRFMFIAIHYGTVKLTGYAYIVNRVTMQLLLSSSCASSSFHGVNVNFITALY